MASRGTQQPDLLACLLNVTVCRTRTSNGEVIYHACSALSELAWKNESACLWVAQSQDALESLCRLLALENGNNQEDAALVINNCAAFCEDTALHIVNCGGVIEALKKLAVGRHVGAKNAAIGALNCLSRSERVSKMLLDARVIEEALAPVLEEKGRGEKYEARVARATMAVANLTGASQPVTKHTMCSKESNRYCSALPNVLKLLDYALDGKKYAGIFFAPYSVMCPLSQLAKNPENRQQLVDAGLIELTVKVLEKWWAHGDNAAHTLSRCMQIAERLSKVSEYQDRLRSAGIVDVLKNIRKGTRGEPHHCLQIANRLIVNLLPNQLAFWMGQHSRLGQNSPIFLVDEYLAEIIMEASLR